jgi:predicted metal-dependent HD superfamily phosphohydrolase
MSNSEIITTVLKDLPPELIKKVTIFYRPDDDLYHTWDHINSCLIAFSHYTFENPLPIKLALLFHDAIYQATSRVNEEKSVDLAKRLLVEYGFDQDLIRQVIRLIMLTKNHWANEKSLSRDEKLFLDIDLGILGQPDLVYQKYVVGIQNEWREAKGHVFIFNLGRALFLAKVIRREKIFLTDEFNNIYGGQARKNLEKEFQERNRQFGFFSKLVYRVLFMFFRNGKRS